MRLVFTDEACNSRCGACPARGPYEVSTTAPAHCMGWAQPWLCGGEEVRLGGVRLAISSFWRGLCSRYKFQRISEVDTSDCRAPRAGAPRRRKRRRPKGVVRRRLDRERRDRRHGAEDDARNHRGCAARSRLEDGECRSGRRSPGVLEARMGEVDRRRARTPTRGTLRRSRPRVSRHRARSAAGGRERWKARASCRRIRARARTVERPARETVGHSRP